MFKKLKYLLFVGVALACLMPLAAGAYPINFNRIVVGTEFYSPYYLTSGFVTETFDTAVLKWSWSGNGQFKTGSDSTGAAPAFTSAIPDPTIYVAVPKDNADPKTFDANVKGTYNYFGLWWGSADWAAYGTIYNELRFFSGANQVAVVTANDVFGVNANGNWYNANDNSYVNIYGLPNFDRIQMWSSTYAFEADNMTVGVVPEPATMLLFGLGLLGLAGLRRKFKK